MRQYHLDKLGSDIIELSWDLFNMCNYDCTYCYMKDKPDDWLKIANWDKQLEILDIISKSNKPLSVSLVGGEPTLFHKFNEFIERLDNALLMNGKINSLTVISNNTFPEKLLDIPQAVAKRINLNLSYHAEEVDDITFIANVNKLKEHGFKEIIITVLMHYNKKYWDKIKNIVKEFSKLNVKIETSYLTKSHKFFKYPKGFEDVVEHVGQYTDQSKKYVFEGEEKEYFGEFDLIKPIQEGRTKFKGWNCLINRFIININCDVSTTCVGTSVNLKQILGENKIDYTVCPYNECTNNCHLSFIKCEKDY